MKISSSQSDLLNVSRWVAAWLVVAEHARSLMFQDFGSLQNPGLMAQGFYFLTGFGYEAVMIFFVISGYLVGGKVLARMRAGDFHWKPFLIDRVSRLYAVLIVALLAGWFWDSIGLRLFEASGVYTMHGAERIAVIVRPVSEGLGLPGFFGNLLFLQTVVVAPFGSNAPLWSLANEGWYYLLFPSLLVLFFGRSRRAIVLSALFLVAALYLLPITMLVLFGVWLLGVIVSVFRHPILSWWLAALVCGALLAISRMNMWSINWMNEYSAGVGFALLLISISESSRRFPMARISERLAVFSYSLYVLHFPFLLFLVSGIHHLTGYGLRMSFSMRAIAVYVLVISVVIAMSWLVALFTEAKTGRLRAILRNWFHVADSKAV